MRKPDYYETDVLAFFAGRPWALPLYEALFSQMEELFPEAAVKVQKSQISFYGRHLFAAVSLPYPRRWTHHVLLSRPEEVDGQLLDWLREAYVFSQCK